jgi:hypothetical protein
MGCKLFIIEKYLCWAQCNCIELRRISTQWREFNILLIVRNQHEIKAFSHDQ